MAIAILMVAFGAVGVLLGILIHVRRIEKAVDKIAWWLFGLNVESENDHVRVLERPRPLLKFSRLDFGNVIKEVLGGCKHENC